MIDWFLGLLTLVLSIGAALGIFEDNSLILNVSGIGLIVLGLGFLWSWLNPHKIDIDFLGWIVGLLSVALSAGVVVGISVNSVLIVSVCAAPLIALGVVLMWSWLASHKIYLLPGFILFKVHWRTPREKRR